MAALGQWQVGGQSGEDHGRVVEGRVVLDGSEYGCRRQGEKSLVALLPVDLVGRFQRFVSMLGEVSAVGVFQAGLLFFEAMFQQVRHPGLQGLVDFAVVDQVVASDCGHAGEQRGVIEQPLLHADATVEQAQRGYFRRSEERRVGKECRTRWSPDHEKKKRKRLTGGNLILSLQKKEGQRQLNTNAW